MQNSNKISSSKNRFNFVENDCNTIDDITGFKIKFSEVKKRWDGFYTREGWYPRQPQDFPVIPDKQRVIKESRSEQVYASEGPYPPPPII